VASGIPESTIALVPSGVDLTRTFTAAPSATLRELGIPADGGPLAVMVGALVAHKDPATFVRAIAEARRHVPALRALLVGEGPLRPMVEALVREHALGDALRLAGFRQDADALIAAADVFVLSSAEEGLGTVLLDALAAGTPVAATAGGGIPEIIEDGRSGLLVAPHDARALGTAIARIVGDASLAQTLAAGGREKVLRFSVAETARRTLEVYRTVLAT
jgi:glycosyltransferase involved in cell wall biosynthesis